MPWSSFEKLNKQRQLAQEPLLQIQEMLQQEH